MYAISNMVDIWGAKVHKLATYYGWSNMAGGKPKLNNINGLLVWVETFHNPEFNVKEGFTPKICLFWYKVLFHSVHVYICIYSMCV